MKEEYWKGNPDDPTGGQNPDWIATAMTTWFQYPGYSGAGCGKCNVVVNAMNGPGWFCPSCGHFNCVCFHGGPMPVEKPTWGPSLAAIKTGGKLARLWTERKRLYLPGHRVWIDMRRGGWGKRDWRLARVTSPDKEKTTYVASLLYYNLKFFDNHEDCNFPQGYILPVLPKHWKMIERGVTRAGGEIFNAWEEMGVKAPAWASGE